MKYLLTGYEQIALDAGKDTSAFDALPGDSRDCVWAELDKAIHEGVTLYERENDPSLLIAAGEAGRKWIAEMGRIGEGESMDVDTRGGAI